MSDKNTGPRKDIIPPLDFGSLMLPFYTQAMVKLGQISNPVTQKKDDINIELAKRLIDLLDLLKEKTEGNLDEQEEKVLNDALSQLKNIYIETIDSVKS
ncbi:MAG: DUF1844 domain-containing protein [Candidatus Aminicenantes bacterium]